MGRVGSADRAGGLRPEPASPSRPEALIPSRKPYRLVDLFSGIGGFSLGLERTGGFKTVAVAEVDKYASNILRLRFPDAPNVGDVTVAEYPDADIICGGFPCQDISYAGAGAGLAGSRSGLFWEVVRAIRVVRPKYVILENVAALLSRGLDVVLRALAEVGYDAEWHCIPASAVGAPHQRDRIWIIAYPGGEQHQGCRAPLSGQIAEELARAYSENVANPGNGGHEHFDGLGQNPGASGETCGTGNQRQWLWPVVGGGCSPLADADCERQPQSEGGIGYEWGWPGDGCCQDTVADAECVGCEQMVKPISRGEGGEGAAGSPVDASFPGGRGWWAVEPDVGRVAHGVPHRVDRLRALGNAVVPQIPELIGHAILASERTA